MRRSLSSWRPMTAPDRLARTLSTPTAARVARTSARSPVSTPQDSPRAGIQAEAAARSRAARHRGAEPGYPSAVSESGLAEPGARVGQAVIGLEGARIGRVDAVFVDYLLVRTAGLLPVDLYVPRAAANVEGDVVRLDADRAEAYERWHRPLRRVNHD
jgi:hypothetical protein